jgi:hypothetical protein
MYKIESIGNDYWESTTFRKTLQEALEEYNKELIAAKLNADIFGPIKVYIMDTDTKEIIISESYKEGGDQ